MTKNSVIIVQNLATPKYVWHAKTGTWECVKTVTSEDANNAKKLKAKLKAKAAAKKAKAATPVVPVTKCANANCKCQDCKCVENCKCQNC